MLYRDYRILFRILGLGFVVRVRVRREPGNILYRDSMKKKIFYGADISFFGTITTRPILTITLLGPCGVREHIIQGLGFRGYIV